MKMIAAVRLRRAQEAIVAARPYAIKLHEVLSLLAMRTEGDVHPLLAKSRDVKKLEFLVITSDRGLCGSFNSGILRMTERVYRERKARGEETTISVIGRKGYEYFNVRGIPVRKRFKNIFDGLNYQKAKDIAEDLVRDYLDGTIDQINLVYNEFKSALSQRVADEMLLPIKPLAALAVKDDGTTAFDYDYEPDKHKLLDDLLPRYFNTQVYRALLESAASEHGARMTAMENASNNAKEMIGGLTLKYNRARQAAITKELMEIIGGAEALK